MVCLKVSFTRAPFSYQGSAVPFSTFWQPNTRVEEDPNDALPFIDPAVGHTINRINTINTPYTHAHT